MTTETTEWDRGFITSINERAIKYGDKIYLSEKQIAKINQVCENKTDAVKLFNAAMLKRLKVIDSQGRV